MPRLVGGVLHCIGDPVGVIEEEILPFIPTTSDMVIGTRVFDP